MIDREGPQPYATKSLLFPYGAHGKQVPAHWHRCGRDLAAAVHLCAAVPSDVQQRSHPPLDLALAACGRSTVLCCRGGGEARHSLFRHAPEDRDCGGSRNVMLVTATDEMSR